MRANVVTEPFVNRRREPRQPLLTHVQLSLHGTVLGMSRTYDISANGFCGSNIAHLEPGQRIGIGINGIGTVDATVLRTEPSRFAARFERPIRVEDVDISPIITPHRALPRNALSEEGFWK
ncbi:MAG: PilZ domain-containing protein [Parasphingopyxis sp.]|uniref:PilZ domain-containing protein n=1 Tax=Parasphingopyxis sp. TaxID=1920299 RepID=UPI003FA003B3